MARQVGPLFVQVFAANCGVGQNGDTVGLNLDDAACHEHKFFATVGQLNAHRARFDPGDQRRVARIDAEFARFARQGDKARLAREDGRFGTHHIDVDGVHGLDLFGFFEGFVNRADHVEGLLGQVVAFASHNHFEAADGLSQRHIFAG